jgi:predicted DNA binding CopG/RHH family protein
MRFELRRKDKTVSLRLPSDLLDAAKAAAAREGIPNQRFMRHAIEQAARRVTKSDRPES